MSPPTVKSQQFIRKVMVRQRCYRDKREDSIAYRRRYAHRNAVFDEKAVPTWPR
jgi:hypothetical protein